jgi:GT2 family glycosyltransferase
VTSGPQERREGARLADVSVVVLCHDRIDQVVRTVARRIADVRVLGLELIVVDNASSDGTREWLSQAHQDDPCFTLVLNDVNLGVGGGRNTGWIRASRAVVITHDEDAHITPAQLRVLADATSSLDCIGITTPVPVDPVTRSPQIAVLPPPHRPTNFHGSCYAVRREVIDSVGLHDEACDFGGEELDYSIRARAAGWDVRQLPTMVIDHAALRRAAPVARWRRERWTLNHARVLWRHFPAARALPWSLLMLLAEVRAAVRRREAKQVPRLVAAWFAGAREGRTLHVGVPGEVTAFYAGRLGLIAAIRRARGGPAWSTEVA